MSSLKELRGRIRSIKSTQKITGAMKMVAAAKLRKSQEKAEIIRPYAYKLSAMIDSLLRQDLEKDSSCILQTGGEGPCLLVVISAGRGLCGSYNSLIAKEARQAIHNLKKTGPNFYILTIGRKGFDALYRHYSDHFLALEIEEPHSKGGQTYQYAEKVSEQIQKWLEQGLIGKVTLITGIFKSTLVHEVKPFSLIPLTNLREKNHEVDLFPPYILTEPKTQKLLESLLKKNLSIQLYRMMLENAACEEASRMTAMDSATRNAQDMIQRLQLKYNQTRQAHITNELIEIISGAEAL